MDMEAQRVEPQTPRHARLFAYSPSWARQIQSEQVLRRALKNPVLPVSLMWETLQANDAQEVLWLLVNPAVPAELLTAAVDGLVGPPDEEELHTVGCRMLVALYHPKVTDEVLLRGVRSGNRSWMLAVASRADLPAAVAHELLSLGGNRVRMAVAARSGNVVLNSYRWEAETSPKVLRVAVDRTFGATRQVIVSQLLTYAQGAGGRRAGAERSTSSGHLEVLCWDEDPGVREAAARNPATSDEGQVAVALLR